MYLDVEFLLLIYDIEEVLARSATQALRHLSKASLDTHEGSIHHCEVAKFVMDVVRLYLVLCSGIFA